MTNTTGLKPPWKPGESGNPNGRPKTKPFHDALQRALQAASGDRKAIDMIAENFIAKVMTGDVPAVKEFADRIDGKVPQAIVGDSEHDPIGIEQIVRKIVDPKSRDSDSPGIPAAAGTGEV